MTPTTTRRANLAALSTLVAALLTACAAPPPPPPPPSGPPPDLAVLGLWRIEQARSAPLTDKSQAQLAFGPDGNLVGHTGCNGLRANFTLEGNALKVGPIATTRMIRGDGLLEQEDRVLTALERAARAAVPGHGFLTLWDADGSVLLRASRIETPR